jgi:RecB family endonuclease NucS
MAQLGEAQKNQLIALKKEFERLQRQLQALHKKTGYEDLAHGVLALEIAEHTVEETLEHTGLEERFATSRTLQPTGRLNNGTRSSRFCAVKGASFLRLIRARI